MSLWRRQFFFNLAVADLFKRKGIQRLKMTKVIYGCNRYDGLGLYMDVVDMILRKVLGVIWA